MRIWLTTICGVSLTITSFAQINFELLSPEQTGLKFQNTLVESRQINVLTYQYYHNGAGVAVGDINNDGLPDIYFVSNLEPNRLFLNKGGMKFEDISPKARVTGGRGWATGTTMVDINGDGLLDIYVCKSGNVPDEMRRNKLYINQGDLTFTEEAASYGIDDPAYSTQAYFLDYDKDGDLDMYLLNHSINPLKADQENATLDFKRDPLAGDKFFRNDNGKYVDVSEQVGVKGSPLGYGLSVSVGDVNGDSYPDLYVCNDYLERDYLYMNQGDGTFKDELTTRTKHISNFSMGSDIADIDNDGSLDIFVADMAAKENYRSKTNMSGMNPERFWRVVNNGFHYQYMINTFQHNNGNGTFSEIAQLAGMDKTDWSWAPLFADFNHDGLKDLFVTNGLRKEARNNDFVKKKKKILHQMELDTDHDSTEYFMRKILGMIPEVQVPNVLFENKGKLAFSKIGVTGMDAPSYSNGAAYADFDGDGDLDLIVSNIDHPVFLYRNDSEKNTYIRVKLKGTGKNTSGIGAKVLVKSGDLVQQAEHYMTRGYLSSVENVLQFGLNGAKTIDFIQVIWADGTITRVDNPAVNNTFVVEQAKATKSRPFVPKSSQPFVKTAVKPLPFEHKENPFDDYAREVLLPHQMSHMGPALASGDVNGDGKMDFYVGGAIGQNGSLFLQGENGEFREAQSELWSILHESEEVVAKFFDFDGDKDLDLYVGTGGNENDNGSAELQDYLFENKNGTFVQSEALPSSIRISTGCIAPWDFDNDGDLDLFVGSRQTPGKYPYASSSYLLENRKNTYVDVTTEKAPVLADIGMVTNAAWERIDEDETPELILTGEWMPVTILQLKDGKWEDQTEKFGLSKTNGWWFGFAKGDVDNDGDIDLIGGNLGLNYKYHASPEGPFQVYSDDMNKDGKNDIVLGYNQDGQSFPLRGRQCSSEQMPELQQEFPTYDLFGKATIDEVYGDRLNPALKLEAYNFSSCLFINEGGKFKTVPFDHNLQSFNWNEVLVEDLNADANLDIIVAGNHHEAEVETPRCDAGNGLILFGNGDGTFKRATTSNVNWGSKNVKTLAPIRVNDKFGILIGNNNDRLELLELTR